MVRRERVLGGQNLFDRGVNDEGPDPFYLTGPTGSGKSALALELAERWGGEIVNADAFQLYQGLPILTAAPSPEDRRRVPHHLYEILDPRENCHAARYADLARQVLADIKKRGRRPLVVGGSGLYLKALTHGLADVPPASPPLRAALADLPESRRVDWLRRLDPQGAASMNLKNPRHVLRALEITLLSGVPASVLKSSWNQEPTVPVRGWVLCWDRPVLYDRINRRVEEMIERGALEEVAALPSALSNTAEKAIGVRELRSHLEGRLSLTEAVAQIQQASRRYAKRQETWFRKEKHFVPVTWDEGHRLADAEGTKT